jgi:phage shock protein PspC (stress-responsive transcriptional regulator)
MHCGPPGRFLKNAMTKHLPPLPVERPVRGDLTQDGDLSDMLSELRILLPGAQMLTAFLIILPFNGGARQIIQAERYVFLVTFFFALTALVLLSAPAIQHRLMRPLISKSRFKRIASRQIVAGSCALGIAFILGTNLVISEVFGTVTGIVAAAAMAGLIISVWLILPMYLKRRHGF